MATKKEIELTQKIFSLCLDITAKGEYTAFFEYAGHVNGIHVRVAGAGDNYNQIHEAFDEHDAGMLYFSESGVHSWSKAPESDSLKALDAMLSRLLKVYAGEYMESK